MRRKQIRHLIAKDAREVQNRLNEEGIRKERIVQIVHNSTSNTYVVFYER